MKRWLTRIAILAVLIYGGLVVGYNLAIAGDNNTSISPAKSVVAPEPVKKPINIADIDRQILLAETNRNRTQNGLSILAENEKLNASALAKCNDMIARNYWSHYGPNGDEKPWEFITKAGYSYNKSGENLAYGQENAPDVINGWMNSPKHRDNMLKPEFTEVGYGVCLAPNYTPKEDLLHGEKLIIVQHLAKPY